MKDFRWGYCVLCEEIALICPKCNNISCSGGGCEFCKEKFTWVHKANKQEIAKELPESLLVLGKHDVLFGEENG